VAVHVATGAARPPTAAEALGPTHPLARAADARHALARQLQTMTVVVALSLAGVDVDGPRRVGSLLMAGMAVEMCLAIGVLAARACVSERARDLIADGGDVGIAEVAAECPRLVDRRHRAALAAALERAAEAADRWHALAITTRPPPSVRNLAEHRAAIDGVVAGVAGPDAPPVRAVALLDRLVRGGYAAPLYVARSGDIARELARIRALLAGGADGVETPGTQMDIAQQRFIERGRR
jgi:hypothetical protein